MNRNRSQFATFALAALMSMGIAGCSFFGGDTSCARTSEYHASEEIPPMRVPADLDEPDRSASLAIPGKAASADIPPKSDACLERPPDYFEKQT